MDGVITAEDFERAGRRVRGISVSEGKRLRGVHLVAWYLQADDDRSTVGRTEVREALAAYDRNADGRIGRSEFEASYARRATFGRRPAGRWAGLLEVETTDPWERLILVVDGNDDGFMTTAELDAFYLRNESEWAFDPDDTFAPVRSLVGHVAPDFTLPRSDRDERVTLSDFAGDRPVALIFGSYT